MEEHKVALVIIFNHKYDKNIKILKRIYGERFSHIYFLVPFYEGDEENVIPVYENSYYFQGYVAQGFKLYFKEEFEHYIFIGDDLLLNPSINEKNYQDSFKVAGGEGFIPQMSGMPNGLWPHNRKGLIYNPALAGVEISGEIPSAKEAEKIVSSLNIQNKSYSLKQVYFADGYKSIRNIFKKLISYLYDCKVLGSKLSKSHYPYIVSYSDIFIVSKKNIKKFVHYSGAFAASDLFVELAIPTAMALTGEKIKTEKELSMKGRPLWTAEDYKELDAYNLSLKSLLENFPREYLFIHPVKLSKWTNDI